MTWSPAWSSRTPAPTLSTVPAPSSPSTMGTGTPFQLPSAAWRQLWQTPLAAIRTSTSPSRGPSRSSSSTRSGAPCSKRTEAFMDASVACPAARSTVTDAGIEPAVEEVDGKVDHHEERRDEQDGALGQRVVALIDVPEEERADTGKGEDLLHHHGTAEEDAYLEPGHRDDGDEGVAQGVLEDDGAGGEPLGRGRADVLGAEHVEHAGARGSRDVGGRCRAQADGGQDHDGQVGPGTRGEIDPHHRRHPEQVEREEEDEHGPLPEDGNRQAEERADARDIVEGAVASGRGDDARGDADQEREAHGETGQLEGDGQSLEDEGEHGLACAPRGAEIAVGELAHPPAVLDVPRLIEAEEALELSDHGGAGNGVGADHLLDDGAGHEAQHEEHEQGQPQERQSHRVQSHEEIPTHRRSGRSSAMFCVSRDVEVPPPDLLSPRLAAVPLSSKCGPLP